jgi:preprotein translocase subunit SecA
MFGQLMHGVAQDFVRYVMHVQVVRQEPEPTSIVRNLETHSAEDETTTALEAAARVAVAEGELVPEELAATPNGGPVPAAEARPTKQQTVVNDEWAKTGRNAPCPCGSGKKYKLCHGR